MLQRKDGYMKNMDARTLAHINLFAILGAIPKLCELSSEARALIEGETIAIKFAIKGGPVGVLRFENGAAKLTPGDGPCHICLPFSTPEKFNGMIDGTVTPIPSKGFAKIGYSGIID